MGSVYGHCLYDELNLHDRDRDRSFEERFLNSVFVCGYRVQRKLALISLLRIFVSNKDQTQDP